MEADTSEDEYGDTVSYDSFSERENESDASEEKDFGYY